MKNVYPSKTFWQAIEKKKELLLNYYGEERYKGREAYLAQFTTIEECLNEIEILEDDFYTFHWLKGLTIHAEIDLKLEDVKNKFYQFQAEEVERSKHKNKRLLSKLQKFINRSRI